MLVEMFSSAINSGQGGGANSIQGVVSIAPLAKEFEGQGDTPHPIGLS